MYEDSGEPYFENGILDYLVKQNDEVVILGATEFYYLLSNIDDPDSKTVEENFLNEYGFTNEKGQLVDSEGRLIDRQGRHLDKEGNFIKWTSDTDFEFVDSEGRPVDKDTGSYSVGFSPFLNDDGDPVELKQKEESKPKPKKRGRPRKKKAEEPALEKNESEGSEVTEEVAAESSE